MKRPRALGRKGIRTLRNRVPIRVEDLESRRLLSGTAGTAAVAQAYGQLPLSFEANQGQTDAQVAVPVPRHRLRPVPDPHRGGAQPPDAHRGRHRCRHGTGAVLRMQLVGANAAPQVVGLDQLPGTSNYLIGNDPSQWHTDVPNYAQVEEPGRLSRRGPGLLRQPAAAGVRLHGRPRRRPRGHPAGLPGGRSRRRSTPRATSCCTTAGGDVVEQAPVLYQEVGGRPPGVSGQLRAGGRRPGRLRGGRL